MTIILKKPIPVYQSECPECHSIFQYTANEVHWMHIDCPVCGVSVWASQIPVDKIEKDVFKGDKI